MIAVMCIMMEVVLIMMEVMFITCGMTEFGLHCCVAQALAGIEGRGYHNSNAARIGPRTRRRFRTRRLQSVPLARV